MSTPTKKKRVTYKMLYEGLQAELAASNRLREGINNQLIHTRNTLDKQRQEIADFHVANERLRKFVMAQAKLLSSLVDIGVVVREITK